MSASSSSIMRWNSSQESAFLFVKDWTRKDELFTERRKPKNCLSLLTIDISKTYKVCNPDFKPIEVLPQRLLSNPSEPVSNNGQDNVDGNLICRVHDKLKFGERSFTILDLLGTGTFGQVFRCKRDDTKELVAVKVIKNKPAYHTQGMLEIKIARLLNNNYDPSNEKHIVRLLESFEYYGHICLVFELLSMSLLDLLTQNQFRGLPLPIVQRFTRQILTSLTVLEDANIIHCDLKPENILLVPAQQQAVRKKQSPLPVKAKSSESTETTDIAEGAASEALSSKSTTTSAAAAARPPPKEIRKSTGSASDIKVIDFGSACFEGRTIYSYIQSRFYRSPEVLLGAPYTGAIDMWSLACVCAEMYLGLPLFPGVSQHNQLSRIVEMLGNPPDFLIECKNGLKYFSPVPSATATTSPPRAPTFLTTNHLTSAANKFRIKTAEEYAAETNTEVPVLKKYLRYTLLEDIIMKCSLPNKSKMTAEQRTMETLRRQCFLDFLRGLFRLNPFERWTAKQAIEHPFIKGVTLTAPFNPPADLKVQERKLMFMVQMQQRASALEEANKQQQFAQQQIQLKGLKAPPSNFSNSGAQAANFTPLQHSHRRLSEPADAHIAQGQYNKNKLLMESDRPLLRRGDPVHGKNNTAAAQPSKPDETSASTSAPTTTADTPDKAKRTVSGEMSSQEASPTRNVANNNSQQKSGADSTKPSSLRLAQQQAQQPSSHHRSGGSLNNSNNNSSHANQNSQQQKQRRSFTEHRNGNDGSQQQQLQAQQQQMAGTPTQSQWIPVPPPPQSNMLYGIPNQFMNAMSPGQYSYNNGGMPTFPVPPPQPWHPNFPGGMMLPPPPPFFGSMDGNSMMYPPAMGQQQPIEGFYVGSQPNNGAGTSYGPSSFGVFAIGSMQQDGTTGMKIADFATKLQRPDVDEQRRMISHNTPQQGYWPGPPPPTTNYQQYGPGILPMMDHSAYAQAYNMMHGVGMQSMPMAQSYDSRMHPPRMNNGMLPPPPHMMMMPSSQMDSQQQQQQQQQQPYMSYQQAQQLHPPHMQVPPPPRVNSRQQRNSRGGTPRSGRAKAIDAESTSNDGATKIKSTSFDSGDNVSTPPIEQQKSIGKSQGSSGGSAAKQSAASDADWDPFFGEDDD